MEPLITIIVPVYNKIRYINNILLKISQQSFMEYECILIDDGSNDGSEVVCDDFAQKDGRFKVFHIMNKGVSHARNRGLDCARGKYITFIDADDDIHTDYLKNLYNCMQNTKVDMVIGNFLKMWDTYTEENENKVCFGKHMLSDLMPEFANIQKQSGVFGWCWAKLLSKDIIGDIRFDESLKLAEDFDFYLKIYPKVTNVFFDKRPYYYYRQNAENSSFKVKDDEIDYYAQIKINLRYRDFLKMMKSYSKENQKILEERLSSYVYFVLYHSNLKNFLEKFDLIYQVVVSENIELHGNGLRRVLFSCVKKNRRYCAYNVMKFYHFIRNIVRGV